MKANTKHSRLGRLARSLEVMCLVLAVMFSGTGGVALASVLAAPARGLGSAANFQVLGGSTVTNTGATVVAGELGTSPGTTITGFPPGIVTDGGTTHIGDALALQAQNDVALAYNSSAGQPCNIHLAGQELGGKTLTPDVYCFSSLAQLTGQLVLDAQGNTAAVWIIQIPGGLEYRQQLVGRRDQWRWCLQRVLDRGRIRDHWRRQFVRRQHSRAHQHHPGDGGQPVRSSPGAKWGGDAGY